MRWHFSLCVVLLIVAGYRAGAQSGLLYGELQHLPPLPDGEDLRHFQVFRIDATAWAESVLGGPSIHWLDLDTLRLPLTLEPAGRYRPDSWLRIHTEEGETTLPGRQNSSWAGHVSLPQGGSLRLTLTPDHVSGGFLFQDETWILEPLWYREPTAGRDLVLLYRASEARIDTHSACLALPAPTSAPLPEAPPADPGAETRVIACKLVDYSAAIDWQFFQTYGSADEALNRLETVMGLVELQYSSVFNQDYLFPFLEVFLSACPTCDPPEWTGSTDAGALLGYFRDWAQAGGFALGHFDVSSLWTGRTLDANVLGAAYIQGVCNGTFRYQVLRDFSPDNSLMRAMVSHEFGHSFSAVHDAGDGFIMSTPLNNTTQWSAASIQFINNFTQSRFCLSNCYNDPPPVAQFEGQPRSGCAPLTVAFTDQSLNDPSVWSWSFPGGSPQASNLQHPEVSYAARGSFTVSLTASNPFGNNTRTEAQYITVEDVPVTGFDLVADGRKVWFTNNTQFAEAYFWDFGDGQQSQESDPVHTYSADGTFPVTLVTQNGCGQSVSQRFLTIATPPVAGFLADTLEGCPPLPVRFTDVSSANTQQRLWLFPGGTPDSSTLSHPEVLYSQPGAYTVTLIVRNNAGTDTLRRTDYIRVRSWPDSVFLFAQDGDSVFVAWPGEADSVRWDFGDGNFSQGSAATHEYAAEGIYVLSLWIWSLCGETRIERTVSTLRPPVAKWTVSPSVGCRPLQARFTDQSEGALTEIQWFFPGGSPETSEDPEVDVVYAVSGWHPAGLIISNPAGTDTLWRDSVIRVADSLLADFTHSLEGLNVSVESQTTGAEEHFWQFGDGNTALTAQANHTYAAPGIYTLTYQASNGCNTDSLSLDLQVLLTLVNASEDLPQVRLWPNPASEVVQIAPWAGEVYYQWHDGSGRTLARGEASANDRLYLSLPPGPAGWYILQLFSGERRWVFRVFRQ
jgi:PKD repeat protein